MNEELVSIQNLSKTFSSPFTQALKNISAKIPKGEIVGLVGPDGAGKTTLIRLLAGLLLPTEGSIKVAGFDTVTQADKIHELCGYMPQKFGLYEELTVMQNLQLYAKLRDTNESFEKLLHFTRLKPFTERLARDLSGGMKQKLGLACALIKRPTLLLLDEPSVGIDPLSRRELWTMVEEQLEQGISVIWSTAYLDEAEKCHTVLLINEGELLYFGKPYDLTKTMEGRVFKVANSRKNLSEIMQRSDVLDGVIQGDDLRIVMKENKKLEEGEEIPPRFEDAFMAILGGSVKGVSKLSEDYTVLNGENEERIVTKDLTKKFGDFTAANHISFSVKKGEVFGLLGPNGAGKSTTFRMLCGLLKPTSGVAIVLGFDLQKAPSEARAQIGYMAQKFSLHGHLSVLQNLEFFSGVYGLYGKEQEEAIAKMVDIFNLKNYLGTSTEILPLGYKKRLSLACAVMHKPAILFLDEPTSGVDPMTRREFWNHINSLVQKGVTVMVTTHFMEEAEYCDRIALIYRGEVIELNAPSKLKESVRSKENENPTLEDAFIKLMEGRD